MLGFGRLNSGGRFMRYVVERRGAVVVALRCRVIVGGRGWSRWHGFCQTVAAERSGLK